MFRVFEHLAVDLEFGTLLIDGHVQRELPEDPKLTPWHLRPFDILTQSLKTCNVLSFAKHEYATAPADETLHYVVVLKPVTLMPYSFTPVMVSNTF